MQVPSFNTEHVKNLAEQMKKNTDPDVIRVLSKQHMKQVSDIAAAISKEQAEIAAKLLPLLKLPSPTPPSILKWVKKVATGFATPQLEAQIKFIQKTAKVSAAVGEISSALAEVQKIISEIQEVSDEIKGELSALVGDALGEIGNLTQEADKLIGDSLSAIGDAQSLVNAVTGGSASFDLSSPSAFLSSADSSLQALKAEAQVILSAVAPVNTVLPTISGTAEVGQTLTLSSTGTWTGTAPIEYTKQWKRDGVDIPGATGNTYVLTMDDYNRTISCAVTADNNADNVVAVSDPTATVVAYGPTNTVDPAVTGTAQVGQTLTCSTGTWTGTATISYSYQWVRNDTMVFGANSSTYSVTSSDLGATLKCAVTASNPVSSVTEVTAPTVAVVAAP